MVVIRRTIYLLVLTGLLLGLVPTGLIAHAADGPSSQGDAAVTAAPSPSALPTPSPTSSPSPTPSATPDSPPNQPPAGPQPTAGVPASTASPKISVGSPKPQPPAVPAAVSGPPAHVADRKPFEEGVAVPGEVIAKRTQTSRTIENDDGTFTLESFAGPIHFKDKEGRWQQIESDLVAAERAGYAFRNRANSFSVHLKERLQQDALSFEVDDQTFTLTPSGLGGRPGKLVERGQGTSSAPHQGNKKVARFSGLLKGWTSTTRSSPPA